MEQIGRHGILHKASASVCIDLKFFRKTSVIFDTCNRVVLVGLILDNLRRIFDIFILILVNFGHSYTDFSSFWNFWSNLGLL